MSRGEEHFAIEFLDTAATTRDESPDGAGVESSVHTDGPRGARWMLLLLAVGVGAWLVGTGDPSTPPEPVAPSPTVAPISPMLDHDRAIGGDPEDRGTAATTDDGGRRLLIDVAPWPAPPLDRDPYVVRVPGGDDAPSGLEHRTIAYVNVSGDPTVVSFATGDVYRIDVASVREHEVFAVENGEVRSLDGVNPGLRDASENAVIFHARRGLARDGMGAVARDGELRLCLTPGSCDRPDDGPNSLVIANVSVERFDPERHPDLRAVLDVWERADRWVVSPAGYRIPAPADVIWVLTALPL